MPTKRKVASGAAPAKRPRLDDQTETDQSRTTRSSRHSTAKTSTIEAKKNTTGRLPDESGSQSRPLGNRKRRKSVDDKTEATNSTHRRPTEAVDDIKDEVGETEEQYWLMKAEPNDRFENGHNVKFSIDDLAAATEPEPWDGVRNYVARNNMRGMRKGDLAFFYHSNCASPAIVGIMRIVEEHSPDESAFNPKHPYYDPKSQREKPKWDVVRVEFVKKFEKEITLKMVNENAASSKELAEMDLMKYKRLSVNKVRPREWEFILQWAGESLDVGKDQK